MSRYDPHAELLAAIFGPQPEPIVVDREMVAAYFGMSKNGVHHLFEKYGREFKVIGKRHTGHRPRNLYDLRQVAQVVNLRRNHSEETEPHDESPMDHRG